MSNDKRIRAQTAMGLRHLQGRVSGRPVLQSSRGPLVRRIVIDRGNTLDTTQFGIKYQSTLINEVPSAYDPDVTSSFIDGIGRGTLEVNGVLRTGYVLVVNDTRSGFAHSLLGENGLPDGPDKPWAFYQVSIPVAGSGAVIAWVVG